MHIEREHSIIHKNMILMKISNETKTFFVNLNKFIVGIKYENKQTKMIKNKTIVRIENLNAILVYFFNKKNFFFFL